MMDRYIQTLSRISAGVGALAMLGWFLWPRTQPLLQREDALFAFLVTAFVWILTEIKESDEVIYRASTKNDIRLAREMVSYASDKFLTILRDHDFHNSFLTRYLTEIDQLLHDFEVGTAFFQDRRVQPLFADLCAVLKPLRDHLAVHSGPSTGQPGVMQSIRPLELIGTEYGQHYEEQIGEANRLASLAWRQVPPLVARIKERVPEAFDEAIEYGWFRSSDP